jgi:hypothetical protein
VYGIWLQQERQSMQLEFIVLEERLEETSNCDDAEPRARD